MHVLVEKLETTRRDMERFGRTRCLLRVALIVLILAGLLAAADWLWVLNTGVRTVGLLSLAVVTVILLGRLVVNGPRFRRQDAAAEAETAFPQLGQRVRTTLEYTEPASNLSPASAELIDALATDTTRRTRELDFRALIPWRSLRWLGTALAGLAMVYLVLLLGNEELRTAALRLLLVPTHYTRLAVKPGDHILKAGSDVPIEATLTGRPVAAVDLCYRPTGSVEDWMRLSLAPLDVPTDGSPRLLGTLRTNLANCDKDLEYRVVAGPVESPVYHLTVLHPLLLQKFEATIQPPAYTRKPAVTVKDREFQVIAGSSVRFRISLDRKPRTAKLLLYSAGTAAKADGSLPSVPLTIQGNELTGELPSVESEREYEIIAEAADGMRLEPSRSRIRVQTDRRPTIRFVRPSDPIEVTPSTEVRMKIEAGDDFGLSKVGIVYQIGNGSKKALYLHQDPGQPPTLQAEATLALEEHRVGFQDGVTYYAFAEDNHPTRPQCTTTELQFIDIRPYKRTYQLVEGGGCCKGNSTTLEELIARQRQNLRHTFAQSEQPAVDTRTCRRLSQAERELSEATTEFTDGLEQRFGPIPCLHAAREAMEKATTALDKKDIKAGSESEQAALTELMKARQNLRKLLSDSKCASACRKYDAQQHQKLRKPPRKDDKAERAKLQEQIEKLAQEEKKIAKEIAGRSGASSRTLSETKGSPSDRQQKAAQQAEELRRQVRQDEALTDLARERMDAAAEAIGASERSLQKSQGREAAQQAAEAAEQLERLARQVAGLKAAELASRLAHGQSLARQLARQQHELEQPAQAKGSSGDKRGEEKRQSDGQRGLTEEARTLADLLARLQSDAAGSNPRLADELRRAGESNPPSAIVEQMRRAADALQAGRSEAARRDMDESARRLGGLAQQLEAAHRGLVQPQLAKLIAAEKQAAQTQKALDAVNNERQKAEAEKKVADLRDAMEALRPADGKLTAAAEALAGAVRRGGGWTRRENVANPSQGAYVPPREYTESVQNVVKALQMRIQEIHPQGRLCSTGMSRCRRSTRRSLKSITASWRKTSADAVVLWPGRI